jgi:hypothetical protein
VYSRRRREATTNSRQYPAIGQLFPGAEKHHSGKNSNLSTTRARSLSVEVSNNEFNGGDEIHSYVGRASRYEWTNQMTKIKILSAVAILSAAIASPVFAQDAGAFGPTHAGRGYVQQNFRGAYNQSNAIYAAPLTNDEYRNLQNFGTTGRDPSRIGGESPWLNPAS